MTSKIRTLLIVGFLGVSLVFNVALVTSKIVFTAASTAIEAITGNKNPLLRSANEAAEMSAELDVQKRANKELRAELADAQAEVIFERQAKREVRSELAKTSAELAAIRASRASIRNSVTEVSERVSRRATRAAKREVAASAGESVPFWGVAAIVAATAWELNDLCQTAKDMNQLQAMFDPSLLLSEDTLTACGFEVPSKAALIAAATSAPETAWAATREAIPSLEEVKEFELPEMSIKDVGDALGTVASNVADGISESSSMKLNQLKSWWNEQ